ncbi:hypothetical protein FLO80_07125 [Aquicoccus porphyridii]|uniref:Uncharacterized protein n=2 Tax=Aquicoccus porphyridii TaxID=1852029 RepID=A0A5A9ZHY7_9RHOB|nr:hypothetical protein FLO80_07125 [Aquicoccus porphyridii]RAI53727.1 hypothetical protein DOO74_09800 [Rhodobacteraceae bacterium AsT-22]
MNIPTWTKPAVWGAVGGAVGMLIVSLSAGWMVTSGTARQTAEQQTEKAVIAALTPICIAEFRKAATAQQQLHIAALEDESSWEQGDYIEEQGWATLPGQEQPNVDVAEACAEQLLDVSST